MSLPRYPEYRDSGVDWIGQVPSSWGVDRLKASITSCKNGIWGDEPKGDESDIDCVRVADFDRVRLVVDGVVPTQRSVTQSERIGRVLQRGDLLLEKSGGGERQPVGQVVLYDRDSPAVCSNFVAKITLAEGMVPRFWMYQHAAAYARGVNIVAIKQTSGIQNLDQSQYFDERGVFPSQAEQVQIAKFLDREIAKIDALIAEQEKLLTLLAEKRQATISHAVTRGLDPHAPMKDSGIPWLGEAPAHWRVGSLRNVCESINTGPFGTALGNEDYVEGGVPVINPSHIVDSRITPDPQVSVSNETAERLEYWALRRQDIVVARRGELGRAAVVGSESEGWICGTGSLRLRVSPSLATSEFIHAVLQSRPARDWLNLQSVGSTMANLNEQILGQLPVVMPPSTAEQEAVIAALNNSIAALDGVVRDVGEARRLLLERRSALISAAVTGQIDVRGALESEAA